MRISRFTMLALALATAPLHTAAAQDTPFRRGVELYRGERYTEAAEQFHAAFSLPGGPGEARAWWVAALLAGRQPTDYYTSDDATRDPAFANAARAVYALSYWARGDASTARSWAGFFCEQSKPGFDTCARVLALIEAGGPAPAPDEWPRLAGLPAAGGAARARTTPALPASASARPEQPARPSGTRPGRAVAGAPREWLPHGAFRVGDRVRYTPNGGPIWYTGVVERVGPDPEAVVGTTDEKYLIRNERFDSREWADRQQVAGIEREPFWTGFFVGDWEISVPMAMGTYVQGRDVYRVVTGGMRLPPLRVNADGTYLWRVEENGRERVIRGRWMQRDDAPGIVLLDADQGGDWRLSNVTDHSGLQTFGRDQIHLSSDCCTYQAGQRIARSDGGRGPS